MPIKEGYALASQHFSNFVLSWKVLPTDEEVLALVCDADHECGDGVAVGHFLPPRRA